MTYTRAQIEVALDSGHLFGLMANGRYYRLRRNGKTQTWKTRPGEFRIPTKVGLHAYGAITDLTILNDNWFRIEEPTT